jgi:hypothetical protein
MLQHLPVTTERRYLPSVSAVLFTLVLALLPSGATAEGDPLVGIWYGHDRQPDGQQVQRISRRSTNGAISIEFREYENCVLVWRSVEKGTWHRENNIEVVEINSIDGSPRAYLDRYEILEIDDRSARSRHIESGTVFTYQRVSKDFKFPICEFIS